MQNKVFTVSEQGDDFVRAFYENRGEIYPFHFRAEVEIRLSKSGCEENIKIVNTGERNCRCAEQRERSHGAAARS